MKTRVLFLIFCAIILSLNVSAFENKSWSPDFSQRVVIEKTTRYVNSSYSFKTDGGRKYKVLNSAQESGSFEDNGLVSNSVSLPSYGGTLDMGGYNIGAAAPLFTRTGGRQGISGKGDISEYGVKAFNGHGTDDWEYRGLSTPNFTTNSDEEEPVPVGDAMAPMMLLLAAFAAFKFYKK